MIDLIHPSMFARFEQLLTTAKVRTTFVMGLDSPSEHLQGLRKCELFFDDEARADRDLLGMPTLMLAVEHSLNVVVARHPQLGWLDVSNATPEDLTRLHSGTFNNEMFGTIKPFTTEETKPEPAKSVAPTIGNVIDVVLGRIFNMAR